MSKQGALSILFLCGLIVACELDIPHGSIPSEVVQADYVVFAWNDLGMHCLNPTYDEAVILPPYNTVWVQVIRRGPQPEIVTSGITVEYEIVNNTYSAGKVDDFGADFGQFWDAAETLFGATLEEDTGLNLRAPLLHNGLAGELVAEGDHFQVDGIPATPVDDDGVWSPYQVIQITVRDSSSAVIAQTRATLPTSDEINCGKCHGSRPFQDMLEKHDALHPTAPGAPLSDRTPVLCAECHGSPALGTSGPGSAGMYLSEAVHGAHVYRLAQCYDCHPGEQTRCSRSLAHRASDGNCTTCHGSLSEVASSIGAEGRVPWVDEPRCADCHNASIPEVATGSTLYRNATGHGGMYCAACHGSPHAMVPTSEASDNAQALQYQGRALSLGSCGVCHVKSKGRGTDDFDKMHGVSNPQKRSACAVCHTQVSTHVSLWPHHFQWKER